jgi:cytochrome oxidase Cu insertion factor (SCO1/SenC/PrrC family)
MLFSIKKKKNSLFIILLMIAFLISLCSSAVYATTVADSSSFRKYFPAPNFTLKTVDGKNFDLENYKEKQELLILYFCNNKNEESVYGIEKLAKYFEENIVKKQYRIIMINTTKDQKEEDVTGIKVFWNSKKIFFPILLDSQNELGNLYNIEVLPTAIFLDKNLVVKRVYAGLISKQQNLMFQYISYFLDAKEKGTPQKDTKKDDGCNDGVCPPPPGY